MNVHSCQRDVAVTLPLINNLRDLYITGFQESAVWSVFETA